MRFAQRQELVALSKEAGPAHPVGVFVRIARNQEVVDAYKAAGLDHHIVDRSTHPQFYVSSWPHGIGHSTLGGREQYRLPHINFNSVLVVAICNEYAEGAWWRLQNMLRTTEEAGLTVAFEEIDDMSMMPTDAIGIMRACAAMMALDSGFEWCFMVDTDVHLEEDTLLKLIAHDRPVVYPMLNVLHDQFRGAPVSAPEFKPGHGLQPVVWAAMSAMLFNTKVFNCLPPHAWHGHDYHFAQNLAHFGHRIYMDTSTIINVTRGPSRHPSKDWGEMWTDLERAHARRQRQDRDRRPPPNFDPAFDKGYIDKDGVYWAIDSWKYGGVYGPMAYTQNGAEQDGKEEVDQAAA